MSPQSSAENVNQNPVERKVEKMIASAESLDVIIERLEGIVLVQDTLNDPETGNNLPVNRIIGALRSGPDAWADECPIWLIRALNERGF
jgi:hypothetical protein